MATPVEPGRNQYLRQINESALLTGDEEKELARTISRASAASTRFARDEITIAEKEQLEQEGIKARERMIRSNLRLVVNIAKVYGNRGMPLADLIEEGNLGLLRAVEGFDPDIGARFSTYASWWIKQSIKRALINTVQPVHIPAYMVEMIAQWKQVHSALLEELGRVPNIEEVAKRMDLPEKKVRIIKRAVRAVSATTQSSTNESGQRLSDLPPDAGRLVPHQAMLTETETAMLATLIESLEEREATVPKLRYGLGEPEPLTLKDIGERIGLTRERVRQLEAEAIKKLQKFFGE